MQEFVGLNRSDLFFDFLFLYVRNSCTFMNCKPTEATYNCNLRCGVCRCAGTLGVVLCGRVKSHPRPTRVRAPVFRGCPAATHWGDDPPSQVDGSSWRQLVRVSCPLVVVVCLCVALHAHVRLSGMGTRSCHPTMPCPVSASCSYIRGSVFLLASHSGGATAFTITIFFISPWPCISTKSSHLALSSVRVICSVIIPITNMFVFTPPSASLYKIFASPAVSSPSLKIVISVLPSNRSRILDLACVPVRNRAWSSSLPRINRRMRCSDESP